MTCPLCLHNKIEFYHQDTKRDYWQCQKCQLVLVKPEQYLSRKAEKSIYDHHQNNPDDLGYRQFLNNLLIPLAQKLQVGNKGLDFGCGSGATISLMLAEQGFMVADFDIFYANNPKVLQSNYDFITCTEVIEHLHQPHQVLTDLFNILNAGGHLGIMTKRVLNKDKFATWHYKNDPTHVGFYSDETFAYIAQNWHCNLAIINADTVILTKLHDKL